MRSIVSRVVHVVVGVAPIFGIGIAVAACEPAPDCPTLEASFAEKPVKNMSQTNAEQTVWCLTNDQRSAHGLAKLSLNSVLGGTARAHAQDAVTRQWWVGNADTHTNPDGKTPKDRIVAAHYCDNPTSFQVAENTYWGWGSPLQTPKIAVDWWMGDPPHRATILNGALKDLGVGVVLGAPAPGNFPDAAVFVQDFGTCVR